MRLTKEQKGITLIALVITIIVLLILAGVALATLTGNTSIIDNANNAVERYNASANNDQNVINEVENLFAKYLGENSSVGDDDDDDTPPAQSYTITYNANGGSGTMEATTGETPEIATNGFTAPSGKEFKEWNTLADGSGTSYEVGTSVTENITIYAIWKAIAPSVDANGYATAPYTVVADETNNIQIKIPTGFAPAILNGSDSTTSNPGQDGSVKSVIPAANWSSITAAQINAGVVIVNAAGEEFVWVPIPNSSSFARTAWTIKGTQQVLTETSTENAHWEETTTEEYTNMVNSINTNKGFYISRYEASQGEDNVAQSKRGVTRWKNISQTAAITASSNNSIVNTHLMYGIEWDSVLNWLVGKAIIESTIEGKTKIMESADLEDSRSWGKFSNSTGGAAESAVGGINEYCKANNIYDLAGNLYEWTQEKYSTGTIRIYRSGDFSSSGSDYPTIKRYTFNESNTYSRLRIPFQLLLVALDSGSDAV